MKSIISVIKKVVLTVWWLANMTRSYCAVGEQLGVGLSNATEAVISICLAIDIVLLQRAVYLRNVRKVSVTLFTYFTLLF